MGYGDQMTFESILSAMLQRVPDTVDKREGSVIYDALSPAAAELAKAYVYVGFWSHELTDHTYQMISRPNFKIKEGRLYGGFAVCESTFYRYEMRGDEFV